MRILVTGASGFVGGRLCRTSAEKGYAVRAIVRQVPSDFFVQDSVEAVEVADIGPSTDWTSALQDVDTVIHLAARVHVMKESLKDPLAEYRRVNVEGTRHFASAAIRAGVKRIVYVSTVKVNGEKTDQRPFNEQDIPSPQDHYATSKWEAEELLRDLSKRHGIEVVIIRPPLVYGPGVKGNMLRLMQYISRGYPLPLGNINNRRSLISLDNLVDVLLLSASRVECAGHTFLVSDGEDMSTPGLVKRIAEAMGRKPNLVNFPGEVFSLMAKVVPSLRPAAERLMSSLVVDSSKFREMCNWTPPQTIDDGIKSMVSDYLKRKACNAG